MNELLLHRRARRYYDRLPANVKSALKAKLDKLCEDPENYPGAIRMSGEWNGFCRFRHGDLRVIYQYQSEESVVFVIIIGPRGDVYKK